MALTCWWRVAGRAFRGLLRAHRPPLLRPSPPSSTHNRLAQHKVEKPFGVVLCKGILCNWLVCLAVWQVGEGVGGRGWWACEQLEEWQVASARPVARKSSRPSAAAMTRLPLSTGQHGARSDWKVCGHLPPQLGLCLHVSLFRFCWLQFQCVLASRPALPLPRRPAVAPLARRPLTHAFASPLAHPPPSIRSTSTV